jgi:hypothetical protein
MRLQTPSLFGGRHAAIGLLALMIAVQGCSAPEEERAPVVLKIVNNINDAVLRCQLVLAHFMTGDLAPAAPGRVIEIGLLREAATSTLVYLGPGGRLVAVENVLCGADDDWMATRNDINLMPLRAGGTQQLQIACTEQGELSCTADATPKD